MWMEVMRCFLHSMDGKTEREKERGGEGETRIVGYFFSTPPAQKKLAAFALYFVERTRRERLSLFKRIPEIWSYRKENDECESF